jgi:hypothetical protein
MGICDSSPKRKDDNVHTVSIQNKKSEPPKKSEDPQRKASLSLAFIPVTNKSKKEELKKYFNLMNSIGKGTYGLVREGKYTL